MTDFKPTHKIVFTKTNSKETWEVMLCQNILGNGPAFTKAEWELGINAGWELVSGKWLFLGYATPCCFNGTVTVEMIEGLNMKYQHEYTEQILNGKLEYICLDLLQCVYPCDWSDLRQEAINNGVPEEILDDIDHHGLSVRLYAPGMRDAATGFEYHDWEISSVDGFFFDLPKETKQEISDLQSENEATFLHLLAFAIEASGRMTNEVKSLSWFNEVNESIKEANTILEKEKEKE